MAISTDWQGIPQVTHPRLHVGKWRRKPLRSSWEQLSKYHLQFPDDSLKTALRMTASQRNTLRNVHGLSTAALVLGTQPKIPGARCDEDFGLLSQCEICLGRQRPRAVRVAVLPRAKRFNEVICTDVYYITWKKMKERKILAIMGEFTRYEFDYPISKETFLKESKLWEKRWISWRTRDWMNKHGIKLDLIPKGTHHRLHVGLVERNHAVSWEQLSKYHLQFPDDSLKTALRMTASQRNTLRNVHGLSTAALVLGTQPKIPGARCDEDFGLLSQCEICLGRQRPRAVRVAVLPRAKRFNEVICTDVYYITWKKMKERKILAIMGEFTRYEFDYPISKETFLKESKLWEKRWISWAGKPKTIRMTWEHGIKLDLIPKGTHHRLHVGLVERNHAVSWEQISKYHLQFPDDSLKTALRMTASQRNTLRNVHGLSTAALVLGTQPKIPGARCDENFGLSDQAALVDPKSEVHEMMIRSTAAATAFVEANCSRAVRAALLARSRPPRRNYEIGEWVYFWRPEQMQGLEKCHWHGPALVNEDNVMHTSVVWVTHGRAIYRCTAEQLRPELPGEGRLPQYDDHMDDMGEQQQPRAQAPMETDETDGPTGAAAAAAPGDPQPTTAGEDEDDGPAAASAGASGSAAQEHSRFHIEAMAKRSVEEAEKLDGIPLAKRARLSRAKLAPQSEEAALADEVDDEMLLLEESTETVYMLAFKRKAPTIVEGRQTPEEKDQFYAAKLEALEVFNRNDGWEPINEADVDPGACCPLRFLLKWTMKDGQKVANARVLYQRFKHRDVAEGQLDKEAPTLSRLGRHTVMLWASLRKWRLFSADVKFVFLQAEGVSVRGFKLYASPTKEMREMISHQIGLQPGQLLKMIKACFGDPRSPKHYRSDAVAKGIGLKNHKLEDCLLLSLRPARVDDDPFDARSFEGQTYVVDGLIGKHVDDFIGCGEGETNEQDLYAKLDDTECFHSRHGMLNEKIKFGKWDFGPSLVFTGNEVEQSLSTYGVTLKFEKYLHAVKPITVEKHRIVDPTSALSPKELTNCRTLNAQGVIIASATVSFRASATGRATVQDLLDANKDLRFLKANADVGLYFGCDKAWSQVRVGNYTDASWASRRDGSSQGGYAIFIGPADELDASTPAPFVAM
ncbi:unnamed protein product, partial [Prorocentrum cordatum]